LTRNDLLRFVRAYFARPLRLVLRQEPSLLDSLQRTAQRLQARYERKLARGEMT
jgi:heptose I phosphotransferase